MEEQQGRFGSVWDAIENTPQEAAIMKVRSALMMEIRNCIVRSGIDPAQAADRFGVTPSRSADLVGGKIHLFETDALVAMAASAGLRVEMRLVGPSRSGRASRTCGTWCATRCVRRTNGARGSANSGRSGCVMASAAGIALAMAGFHHRKINRLRDF